MNKEDYIKRMPVWDALSRFYLDTELDEIDYDIISKTLIKSQIKISELKAIDLYEVFPTLQLNLLSIAGEWSGFETTWLNEKCLKNYHKRIKSSTFRIYTRMKNRLFYSMRKDHWVEIEKRLQPTD